MSSRSLVASRSRGLWELHSVSSSLGPKLHNSASKVRGPKAMSSRVRLDARRPFCFAGASYTENQNG